MCIIITMCMMKAKHTFFILVLFLGALNQVKAQDTVTMDLKACMHYAVEHSTKIRIQQADNRDAQIDRRDAILAAFTPEISGNTYAYSNFGRSIDPETNTYIRTTSFHNGYSLSGGIVLFNGFQAVNNLKITKTAKLMGFTKEQQLEDQICLATMEAYCNVLYHTELEKALQAQVAQPVRKAVMVDELMERVMRLNKAKAAEQGTTLTYNAKANDLLIFADEGQMMLVFNNLIKNAIQAGANSIRITADLNSEDQTIIRVTNNGKPIPLRQIDEIFVPFYTTKPNGTGIGLSLSRQIMIKHHGDLRLEQSDENMTIFAVIFK